MRLIQIQDGEQFTNYAYDQNSRLVKKQQPNDISTAYKFNELGQLQSLTHRQAGKDWKGKDIIENLDQFHFEYDLMGNKIEANRIRKGVDSDNHGRNHYQYDALNRLTRVTRGYDTLRTYEYDVFGNRSKMTDKNKSISYNYNQLNQLISKQDSVGENYDYTYDGRGNLSETYLNNQLTHKHHFGSLNRLESVWNYEQNKGILYDYNGLGNRVGKRIGLPDNPVTHETDFHDIIMLTQTHIKDVIDLTKPYHNLLRRTHANVIDEQLNEYDESYTNFVYDYGVLHAQTVDETLHYLHDNSGSPIRLINGQGYKQDVFDYDEFGVEIHKNSSTQPFGFTGYQRCEISSNLYAQAREYQPETGRFISEDLIKGSIYSPFTMNHYIYCWNQPMKYVDLNGLYPRYEEEWLIAIRDGNEAEELLREYLRAVHGFQVQPNRARGISIPFAGRRGGYGFPDFVFIHPTTGVYHVYDSKAHNTYSPISPGFNPSNNREAHRQVGRYVTGFARMQIRAEPGGSGVIPETIAEMDPIPSRRHPDRLIEYYVLSDQPGLIFWRHIDEDDPDSPSPVAVLALIASGAICIRGGFLLWRAMRNNDYDDFNDPPGGGEIVTLPELIPEEVPEIIPEWEQPAAITSPDWDLNWEWVIPVLPWVAYGVCVGVTKGLCLPFVDKFAR